MTRTKFLRLAAVVATLAVFGASAQDVQTAPAPTVAPGTTGAPGKTGQGAASIDSLDRNKDGKVSKTEAKDNAELMQQFTALDRDNDGKLTSAEFARFEVGGQTSGTDARSRGGATAGSDSDATGNDPARSDRSRDR